MADMNADTNLEAENTAGSAEASSPKRKKKRTAAIIAAGVAVIVLSVAGGVFLLSHSGAPVRDDLGPPAFSETDRKLLQAVRDNNIGEVPGLLAAGASFSAADSFGVSAMKAAIALNRRDIVRQFLEADGGSPLIREDNSFLTYAIIQNRAEIAHEFLNQGIDVNKVDKNGCTPLRYAVDRNLTTVARKLLKAGADINRRDRYGQTPLMLAVTVGWPDMISLLLESGADTGIVSPDGETAMSIAQRKNRNVVISLLLNAGAPLFY
jgi:ankyrin repeat protein